MCSDISVVSEKAKFNDGHIRLGVVAGDHAALILPLMCGMPKAKYYLLTGSFIEAKEAERLNMVSMVVPHDHCLKKAQEIARQIADGPQHAIQYTKRAMNQWSLCFALLQFCLMLLQASSSRHLRIRFVDRP